MAVKQYNKEYKDVEFSNGQGMTVYCYTTDTRNGFCHHATAYFNGKEYTARVSYSNRTWERFRYESVLNDFIEKFPKNLQSEMTDILIERKAKEDEERCSNFINKFTKLHDSLTDKQKKSLEGVEINSEAEANSVMGIMAMMSLMGE